MSRPDNQQWDRGGDPTPRTTGGDATVNLRAAAASDATIPPPAAAASSDRATREFTACASQAPAFFGRLVSFTA